MAQECAMENGCSWSLDKRSMLCPGALLALVWACSLVTDATTHPASIHCSSALHSGPHTSPSPQHATVGLNGSKDSVLAAKEKTGQKY